MEDIEVAPSADNGNVPVDAPSEPNVADVLPKEEPAKPAEPVVEAKVETLYDLPDGRKVDAATLAKEFKENFLPEFTRKSQELSKLKAPEQDKQTQENPYVNPDYIPKNYAEVIEAAKIAALQELEDRDKRSAEQRQALENAVSEQLTAIKQTDPSLDENALFLHANKYGFKDLSLAYRNMKDIAELTKNVQQVTAKNIAKRADPVSTSNQPSGAKLNPSQFANAVEYMRALNGN